MLELLVEFALFGVVLFIAAGTIRWVNGWAFLVVSLTVVLANAVYVLPRNPEVIVERGRRHTGTRSFDTVVMSGYTLLYVALFVVAGLDAGRLHWAPLGGGWAVLGALLMVVATVPVAGAMAVNRNLEQTVRIQSERGHDVVSTGPYRFVRHPMYLAMLVQLPATALLLGSAWALIPAAGAAVALVVRTALEDRTLNQDLPGYQDYARHTRYRLVPGVW
ncbi:MAG: isoprenylcysteine carboxylmethyltransferase family protein [Kineosporiaceae bacterium]|jgi:protein-S-isoprenylcysteine O-methyltransferase Ste14